MDQALPRSREVGLSVQIEDTLVCGVSHPSGVPRGQHHTSWNRCDPEALPSRVQSHGRGRALVLQLGTAGNTWRCCNAGPDSPICSLMWPETTCEHVPTRATIDLSETLLAPPVTPWFPSSTEAGPFDTGSHRCLQSASRKGGRAEERRSNATRTAILSEIQSSEQGRRLAADLFHLASLWLNIRCAISPDPVVEHIWP